MNNGLSLLHHLQFGNPKGSLSHRYRKIINFNAVEVRDRNFNGINKLSELNFDSELPFKQFIFDTTQTKIRFCKEIATTAGRVEDFYICKLIMEGAELFFSLNGGEFGLQVV